MVDFFSGPLSAACVGVSSPNAIDSTASNISREGVAKESMQIHDQVQVRHTRVTG